MLRAQDPTTPSDGWVPNPTKAPHEPQQPAYGSVTPKLYLPSLLARARLGMSSASAVATARAGMTWCMRDRLVSRYVAEKGFVGTNTGILPTTSMPSARMALSLAGLLVKSSTERIPRSSSIAAA